MKRQIVFLMLSATALGLTIGCLYPERDHRREQRSEPRHDREQDNRRDREQDRDHHEQR